MAKSRKIASVSPSDRNNFLSPEDIEAKGRATIGQAYIPILGGSVYYREIGADKMHDFINSSVSEGGVARIPAMAQFVADILCNEDGSDFITFERAFKFSVTVLDEIIGGVAEAKKEARKNA